MIQVIRKQDRHFADHGWLQTYWLFSFSNYHDPANIQHGALRVFNDDVVAPGTGFGLHPHSEMEIVTIVLEGELSHRDTMGNEAVVRPGDAQTMSAGTGLMHSEFNDGDEPLHLYQIWIFPREGGSRPAYDQKSFKPSDWKNTLLAVASGQNKAGAAAIGADATIYRSDLDAGGSISLESDTDRLYFVYVTSGAIEVNGENLSGEDQARLEDERQLEIKASEPSSFILIDVPPTRP